MAYHPETQTMDVIVDGHPSIRSCVNIRRIRMTHFSNDFHYPTQFEPEVRENEVCDWCIGSDIPHIVTIRDKQC